MRSMIAIVLALAAAAVSASALPAAHQANEVLEPATPKSSSDVNVTLDTRNRPADVRTCICSDHDLYNDEQITEVCCGAGKVVADPKVPRHDPWIMYVCLNAKP